MLAAPIAGAGTAYADPTFPEPGDNPPLAAIRSYERAERVHTAMLSRGFTGRMPDLDVHRASRAEWLLGATVPAVAAAAATASLLMGA